MTSYQDYKEVNQLLLFLTLSFKVSEETVEGKLFRGISINVVMPPVDIQEGQMLAFANRENK